MKIWKISFILSVFIWPLSLYFSNTQADFVKYVIPSLLIFCGLKSFQNNHKWTDVSILLVPFIEPKLLAIPIFWFALKILFSRKNTKVEYVLLTLAIVIFVYKFNDFYGQTVFVPDYESRQEILRNITLYPNVLIARIFQNKAIIVTNNLLKNFFTLLDPNNYFFGFAPRQIVNNQNLTKFPFLTIFIVIYTFIKLKIKRSHFIWIASFFATIANLSVLVNFDRTDFIVWPFISLFIFKGFISFSKLKYSNIFFFSYSIISVIEILRVVFV